MNKYNKETKNIQNNNRILNIIIIKILLKLNNNPTNIIP